MIHGIFSVFDERMKSDPTAAKQELFDESSRHVARSTGGWRPAESRSSSAIQGICMGGATELALAAHGRVMADDKATTMALPEVKIGIFPGAGGTQRVMRMADAQAGLEFLLKGSSIDAEEGASR